MEKIRKNKSFFPESSEPETVNLLQSLVLITQPNHVLEIGTFLGYSTCAIAEVLTEHSTLVTIDQNNLFFQYYKLLPTHIKQKITIIKSQSKKYLLDLKNKKKFDFIFIDASHDYLSVFFDFFLSLKHTEKQSVYVFHDSISKGVNRVLKCIELANAFAIYQTAGIIKLSTPEKTEISFLKSMGKIPHNLSCKSGIAIVTISRNSFYPVFYCVLTIISIFNKNLIKKCK